MKKTFLLICLAAGLLSCTKETTPQEEAPAGVPLNFEINVASTKAKKTDWAEGDVIHVFFKGIEDKYLKMTYNGSSWVDSFPAGDLLDTDFAGLSDYQLVAIHLPVAADVESDGDGSIVFIKDENVVSSYYLSDDQKAYTVEGATVSATLSMAKPANIVLFHVPGIQADASEYRLRYEQARTFVCHVSIADARVEREVPKIQGGELHGYPDADGVVFAAFLVTSGDDDYEFTLYGHGTNHVLTRDAITLEPGKMYNFPALDDPDWVVEELE